MIERDNDAAIQQDRRDSMLRAGIGSVFHDMRLEQIESGPDIKQKMLDGYVAAALARGVGWTIVGATPKAYELLMVFARALLLTGVGVMVTTPDKLLRQAEDKFYEPWDEAEAIPALFLSRFAQRAECPFTRWQRVRVERLIEARLDARLPTFFQVACPMAEWWSQEIALRVSNVNEVIVFGER